MRFFQTCSTSIHLQSWKGWWDFSKTFFTSTYLRSCKAWWAIFKPSLPLPLQLHPPPTFIYLPSILQRLKRFLQIFSTSTSTCTYLQFCKDWWNFLRLSSPLPNFTFTSISTYLFLPFPLPPPISTSTFTLPTIASTSSYLYLYS